jgi:uncharacterized protein YecT (DUF1311 family)
MSKALALFAAVVALAAPLSTALAAVDGSTTITACLKSEDGANRDGRACIGRISDPCLKEPGKDSTLSMVECMSSETGVWDDLLNADYKSLLGVLEGKAADSVRKAQNAWIVTRDADCGVPDEIYQGGTIARLDAASCMLDRTASRVLQLRAWRQMAEPEQGSAAQPQPQ